ncbi:DEAD/DEAH box helicase, partial [Vibrio fluvialis]|nr:DEAD/DEAH box helicase [Vibrio fluvialis]
MSAESSTFLSLGIAPALVERLQQLGIQTPTDIQAQAIPHVLEGKDVLAGAQTGTGKTAAFGLPLIQRFLDSPAPREANSKDIRALVLVPTRELAQQVFDNLQAYAQGCELKIVTAYGGTSMNVQKQNLRGGADILIATPGRLLDHAHVKTLYLGNAEALVLDEADRMLDMGF